MTARPNVRMPGDLAVPLPRLAPELPLPPYAFVPGQTPHPVSDPRGHSFGVRPARPERPDPTRWRECRPYLHGIDLYNGGYPWEAHETWEGLWHACGRTGLAADFFKALIKLAASGVKGRKGQPRGAGQHARRAAELFRQSAGRLDTARYMGLDLDALAAGAEVLAARADRMADGVSTALDLVLVPE